MLRGTVSAAQITVKAAKPVLLTMPPKLPYVQSARMDTISMEMYVKNALRIVINARVPRCAPYALKVFYLWMEMVGVKRVNLIATTSPLHLFVTSVIKATTKMT